MASEGVCLCAYTQLPHMAFSVNNCFQESTVFSMFFFLLRMHLVSSVFRDQTKVIDAKDWSIQMNVHGVNTPNENNNKKKLKHAHLIHLFAKINSWKKKYRKISKKWQIKSLQMLVMLDKRSRCAMTACMRINCTAANQPDGLPNWILPIATWPSTIMIMITYHHWSDTTEPVISITKSPVCAAYEIIDKSMRSSARLCSSLCVRVCDMSEVLLSRLLRMVRYDGLWSFHSGRAINLNHNRRHFVSPLPSQSRHALRTGVFVWRVSAALWFYIRATLAMVSLVHSLSLNYTLQ